MTVNKWKQQRHSIAVKKEEGHPELLYYYHHRIFNKIKVQLIPVSLEIIAIYQCTLLKIETVLILSSKSTKNMQRYCTYILYLNDNFSLKLYLTKTHTAGHAVNDTKH